MMVIWGHTWERMGVTSYTMRAATSLSQPFADVLKRLRGLFAKQLGRIFRRVGSNPTVCAIFIAG